MTPAASGLPRFRLDVFEGPLDLLLHLVKKNEVEIHDIPIALITDQYLATLAGLEELNLDLAGEYLVMAATLIHIKSRMMLPPGEGGEEEGEDPRTELVQQLEEYQRYRQAAARLGERDLLDRDVFRRRADESEESLPPLREMTLADLLDALREVVRRLPQDRTEEIAGERVSVADRIALILERLGDGEIEFSTLFPGRPPRREIVATFLALLELVKLRVVSAAQADRFGPIRLRRIGEIPDDAAIRIRGQYKD